MAIVVNTSNNISQAMRILSATRLAQLAAPARAVAAVEKIEGISGPTSLKAETSSNSVGTKLNIKA